MPLDQTTTCQTSFQVDFACLGRTATHHDTDLSLLELAIGNRIPHMQECGGHGRCTTCRVRVLAGEEHLSPPTELEKRLAGQRRWGPSVRLACQAKPQGDVKIERLVKTLGEVSRLQAEGVSDERGEEKQLAILFCDMRNFTSFVEANFAYDVVYIMNRLFSVLGEPILANNGLIYQYVGDEIVGLFGLDGRNPEEVCLAAVRSALGMESALQHLNVELQQQFGLDIEVGIGIHFGKVIVGRVGHPSHQQFSIIGDAANVASRVQAANKELSTNILASQTVLEELPPDLLALGKIEEVELKGKSRPMRLYELTGFAAPDDIFLIQKDLYLLFQNDSGFAGEFYELLFSIAPSARQLFRNDLEGQIGLMGHMLKGAIYALSRPQNLKMGLRELGRRHAGYGVADEHYDLVGKVLLLTLRKRLGKAFTPETEAAWKRTVELVFKYMKEGSRHKRPSATRKDRRRQAV